MKKKTSLLAFIITAVMVFSLWPQQVNATGGMLPGLRWQTM
ncbi:hypothetical protein [[Ruminococcus] lactaris]|nr:hypothetical protein [[Ruminococcus] lactaris]